MPVPDLARAYADHSAAVFAFALTLTRDEGEAREILQEVFVKMARQKSSESIRGMRAYLLRCAHHVVIDRRRRDRACQHAASKMETEGTGWFAPTDDADATAFRAALTGALAALPQEQRIVVHLKLWDGLTFETIASLVDLPPNTVASRYRYGIEKLRIALRPLYDEIRHLPLP